ncbi:MAG TPA: CRTAC1 family protein [Vicinamibacteria bacterium]
MRRLVALAALAAAALPANETLQAQSAGSPAVVFKDVTAASGVAFRHQSGAFGKKYLPETMGSGVVFLDFDGDGAQDLFFVNSTRWPGRPEKPGLPALYRNDGKGRFSDVTRAAGLAVELYGLGAAAADYDNDGKVDLYVTCLGPNRLFRNLGGGRFSDVTATAGVGDAGFGTSAMFFDYDKDGRLDLVVANYVAWSIEKDLFCTLDGKSKSYCTPESYRGQSLRLYRGTPSGVFEDATKKAGLEDARAKSLGIALIDFDSDAWPDLFVANDTQPNKLYRNNGNGSFSDTGVTSGVAFGETGVARAGMGTDAADYSGSGRPSLVIGNFSNEMLGLYHNEGGGLFIDEAPSSTVGQASLLTLTFAAFFLDYDLDSRLDIFSVGGHVADDIQKVQPKVSYAQPPHLFRNLGSKRFEDVASKLGPDFVRPMVSRGAAYADVDGDGDLDLAVTANGGPAVLLRNDGGNRNGWLRVRLVGTRSNKDGIGARVTATLPGGSKSWAVVKTGSSYCSQSELPLTFGLGSAKGVEALEVVWPSGQRDTLGPQAGGRTLVVTEGGGAR